MESTNQFQSIVKDAEIFYLKEFIPRDMADSLLVLLNDDDKFKYYNLYHYDRTQRIVTQTRNHRKSYWFGDHPQSVQSTNNYITDDLLKKILIPTDYVMNYPFPQEILVMKDTIEKMFGITFNSCLVGKFESPTDKINFHSDVSSSMGNDPYIGSVSFGRARLFKLKKQKKYCLEGEPAEKCDVTLSHGDLLIMRKDANRKYLHMVPADKGCDKDNFRINLTFRNYAYDESEKAYGQKQKNIL